MSTNPGAIPLGRLLAAIGGIYVTQSLITGVAMQSLPALLRAAGESLQVIGLSALFMLPWAFKFLWAPAVERWRLPAGQSQRRSRRIVLRGQWLLAVTLLLLAAGGYLYAGSTHPLQVPTVWLMVALLAAACIAATIDIACDGFAVDQLAGTHRGWGNVTQVGGSYIGIVLGGSVFLLLTAAYGWPLAMAAMGVTIVLLTLPLLRVEEPARAAGDVVHRPSLRYALGRSEVRSGLALTLLCGAGIRLAAGMVGPLLIDRGASLALLGTLNGVLGVGAGLAGTAIGGLLVRKAGVHRAVCIAVGAQAVLLLVLAAAAASASLTLLIVLSGLKFAAMACGFVAIYSLLMGLASPRQAGVDFTLFQCADALIAAVGGMTGGWLAHRWGYGPCFAIAAALAMAATLYLARLHRSASIAVPPAAAASRQETSR